MFSGFEELIGLQQCQLSASTFSVLKVPLFNNFSKNQKPEHGLPITPDAFSMYVGGFGKKWTPLFTTQIFLPILGP